MKKADKLKRIRVAIDYALRIPEIQKTLAEVGFSKADLTRGKALLERVQMLDAVQQKEYGDRYQATDELTKAKQQAWALYTRHLATARFALKEERGHWKTLELSGKRKADLFGWLTQARTFYDNAPLVKTILAKYDLSEAELQQGASMIDAVIEAYNVRQKEDSEAQAATQQRNEVLAQLESWMRRFAQSARLAFIDDTQTLKGLGLMSRATV